MRRNDERTSQTREDRPDHGHPTERPSASKNALSHGLLSRDLVLPNEDAEAFRRLRGSVHSELAPEGAIEEALCEKIVAGLWRLARLARIEADLFRDEIFGREVGAASAKVAAYVETRSLLPDFMPTTETRITDEAAHAKARQTRRTLAAKQATAVLGQVFASRSLHGDVFSKLARYETTIERSVLRWLHELERVQEVRSSRAEGTPPQ